MNDSSSRAPWAVTTAFGMIAAALVAGAYWANAPPSHGFGLDAFVGIVTAGAALVQATIAYVMMRGLEHARRQADAAQKALELSQIVSQQQLRAYICYDEGRIVDSGAGLPSIELRFINCGNTPAHGVCVDTHVRLSTTLEWEPAKIPELANDPAVGANIGPGVEINYSVNTSKSLAGQEPAVARWRNGGPRIICYGVIEYADIFGVPHRTNFCLESSKDDPLVLFLSAYGNEAT